MKKIKSRETGCGWALSPAAPSFTAALKHAGWSMLARIQARVCSSTGARGFRACWETSNELAK